MSENWCGKMETHGISSKRKQNTIGLQISLTPKSNNKGFVQILKN